VFFAGDQAINFLLELLTIGNLFKNKWFFRKSKKIKFFTCKNEKSAVEIR
jgi:hypothetical protein